MQADAALRRVERRQHSGCESPSTCRWGCIVSFPAPGTKQLRMQRDPVDPKGREVSVETDAWEVINALQLCDFHDEVRELARETARALSPHDAIRLHPAAWRATR